MIELNFSAICRTKNEARQLAKLSNQRLGNPYGWNMEWIDSIKNPSWGRIEWWKGDTPPVIPLDWTAWYWQDEHTVAEFFTFIQTAELARKNLYQSNFEKFRQAFPILELDVKDHSHWLMVWVTTRHGGGSSGKPVRLDNEHFTEMYGMLEQMSQNKESKQALVNAYPHLWFDAGASGLSSHVTPAMQSVIGGGDITSWAVYIRYYSDYVEEWRCGTATNYRFTLPLNPETTDRLSQLNQESEKSKRDGWFFCTVCQKAYPRSEYGYYYFAETRCKNCVEAAPTWELIARAETYN